jgi:hypothetical protein
VFSYAVQEQAPKASQPVVILNSHGSLEDQTRALAPLFSNMMLIEIPELHHGVFDVGAKPPSDRVREAVD